MLDMLENDQVILLWQTFIEGNRSSFQQLMEVNYKPLFTYGTKFSSDTELIKDCIQDLFLNLWNKRETISTHVNVKAYLFSSLRRLLHRKVESNARNKALEGFNDTSSFSFEVSVEQQLITEESTAKIAKKIASSLEKLPARQKEIIYLKYFHNFSRDEIAQAMDIVPQTVSNLLQLALKKLRDDFTPNFDPNILFFILPLIVKETIF